MPSGLRSVLQHLQSVAASSSETEKGWRFEELIKRFLQTDPTYRARFSDVWLWPNWPFRGSHHDTGVDLVAREAASGRYVAIQCKCYDPSRCLSLHDLDTFFATLHMQWRTDNGPADSFSGGMVVTTTYTRNPVVTDALHRQTIPCQCLDLAQLEKAPVDWEKLLRHEDALRPRNELRPHQREAIDAVLSGLATADRGKLIMACGTGKTFTSLRLAEQLTAGRGCVLFLAPSIALVAQSLREWMAQTTCALHPIAVCSDARAGRPDTDTADLSALDLPLPATTDPDAISRNYRKFCDSHLTVIFSTYQSLDKVHDAQQWGALPEFALIICDEAHRTTGVSLRDAQSGELDESHFVKVHDAAYIRARKRLYMTATPRIYTEAAHRKAREVEAQVTSMDNPKFYGEELFRLPFSRAVREGLLTDYKVLVLCVDESSVAEAFPERLRRTEEGALQLDELVKLVGCYNGLRKKMILPTPSRATRSADSSSDTHSSPFDATPYDPTAPDSPDGGEDLLTTDPRPMQRAVAFTNLIADSRLNTHLWRQLVEHIRDIELEETAAPVESSDTEDADASPASAPDFLPSAMDHIDGGMDMGTREAKLAWLKDDTGGECRILSNARCLSEGVDVPALDAVIFLSPRNSQVDVVQSVGRVMRRSPGKKYGYIILPIGIPREQKPEDILDKDEKYRVVWDVLQALRAHDDRFNAEINSLELNRGRGKRIIVGGVTAPVLPGSPSGGSDGAPDATPGGSPATPCLPNFDRTLEDWHDAIIARTVLKCGDRRYWESWARNIAEIAERRMEGIRRLLAEGRGRAEFAAFLSGLRENTRPDISEADAVEMLAQQDISRPVFDALFDQYAFAEKNPVSLTMNRMLDFIEEQTPEEDARQLREFYDSVRERARGIDNAAGRQKVIVELYDQFFRNAFPRMADKLGIVYTPVEVVDFIIHSVHHILQQEFGIRAGLGAEGVRILDPFTGTGTFLVRLIQSGLIRKKDLARKYRQELFASEIVLLAYYIACVNIEVAYHGVMKATRYEPFAGLCLTDTFRMHENSAQDEDLFPAFEENGERVKRLCAQDIRVIIGNPPYSAGQRSANDNNQNTSYPKLDARIASTYAAASTATNKNRLYDSYIRAFRWASDRLKEEGVLAFVTNGTYIDNSTMAGFRKALIKEFSSIYCFSLRGAIRGKSGQMAKKEGQNVFDIMTGVCVTILVKKKDHAPDQPAALHYHDIGDYLTRAQKLAIIRDSQSIAGIKWDELTPDAHGDWLNHRTVGYESFLPMGDKATKGKLETKAIFQIFSNGVKTNRDAWCYNSSLPTLEDNMRKTIRFYQTQCGKEEVSYDSSCISWTSSVLKSAGQNKSSHFSRSKLRAALYRPFFKSWLYVDSMWNERVYQMPHLFPTKGHQNLIICFSASSARKRFSCVVSNLPVDVNLISPCQCFPLYWYEKREAASGLLDLGMEEREGDYIRHDAITDYALQLFRRAYSDRSLTKEDIFFYIYGLLHSPEYRTRFANDLKKELPRIPLSRHFRDFCTVGRKLAELHLNYETLEPYPVTEEHANDAPGSSAVLYRVEKMRFLSRDRKDAILYNSHITLRNIPLEAYDYTIDDRSAIEWVMRQYAVTTDKASGIINDPNAWVTENHLTNPRYILDLLKRIIRLSLETRRLLLTLPPLHELS